MAFGLLLGLIGCTVAGIEGIQRDIEDTQERNKARRNGNLTYYDSYGHEHLTSTGRKVITTTMNGSKDVVIRDIKNDKVYYNLSQMRRDKEPKIEKTLCVGRVPSMPAGYRVTFWDYNKFDNKYLQPPKGIDYVEIFTPWNNKEMLELYTKKRGIINEHNRKIWNKYLYDYCYQWKYFYYIEEKNDKHIKFEDFINQNNYPTFEEFVIKYNL